MQMTDWPDWCRLSAVLFVVGRHGGRREGPLAGRTALELNLTYRRNFRKDCNTLLRYVVGRQLCGLSNELTSPRCAVPPIIDHGPGLVVPISLRSVFRMETGSMFQLAIFGKRL